MERVALMNTRVISESIGEPCKKVNESHSLNALHNLVMKTKFSSRAFLKDNHAASLEKRVTENSKYKQRLLFHSAVD